MNNETDLVRKIKNPKTIMWIILLLIAIVSLPSLKTAFKDKVRNIDNKSNSTRLTGIVSDTKTVTITDTPHKIKVPFGKRIHFQLTTEDIPWYVRVNGKTVDERPPINSPEYEDKHYGEHLKVIEVWVDRGKNAQFSYYFKPA